MSMINCKVHVDKKEDPSGDRVVLTFECVSTHSLNAFANINVVQWKIPPIFPVVKCM